MGYSAAKLKRASFPVLNEMGYSAAKLKRASFPAHEDTTRKAKIL